MVDKILILRRLKEYKKFSTDSEFARFLDISTQNMSVWYKRNTFDENKIVDKFPEINKVWLLTGEGEMLKNKETPQEQIEKALEISERYMFLEIIKNQHRTIEKQQCTIDSQQQTISDLNKGNKLIDYHDISNSISPIGMVAEKGVEYEIISKRDMEKRLKESQNLINSQQRIIENITEKGIVEGVKGVAKKVALG